MYESRCQEHIDENIRLEGENERLKEEIKELKEELLDAYESHVRGMPIGGYLGWIKNRIQELRG